MTRSRPPLFKIEYLTARSAGSWSGSSLLIQLYTNLADESKVVQLAQPERREGTRGYASLLPEYLTNKWLAMKNRKDTRAIRT